MIRRTHEDLLAIFHADDGTTKDMLKVLQRDQRINPCALATLSAWNTLQELGLAPFDPRLQTKLIHYLYVDMKNSFPARS